jgi:hypothetical protein
MPASAGEAPEGGIEAVLTRMKYAALRSKRPFYCGGPRRNPRNVERQETGSDGVGEMTVAQAPAPRSAGRPSWVRGRGVAL